MKVTDTHLKASDKHLKWEPSQRHSNASDSCRDNQPRIKTDFKLLEIGSSRFEPLVNLPVQNGLFAWSVVMMVAVFFLKLEQCPAAMALRQVKTCCWTQSAEP